MKKKLISYGVKLLIASIVLSVTVIAANTSFSWFFYGDDVSGMSFQILKIDSIVHMYKANDGNKNGVPDKLDTAGKYFYNSASYDYSTSYAPEGDFVTASSKTYYTEDKSFDYLDSKAALTEDSQYNLLNAVSVENVLPSEIYTFKYVLVNNSDGDNIIAFAFESFTEGDYSSLKVRIGSVEADEDENPSLSFGDWTSLSEGGTTLNLPSELTIKHTEMNVHDVWLQIKVDENLDNDMSNKALKLPDFRIMFQIVEEESA